MIYDENDVIRLLVHQLDSWWPENNTNAIKKQCQQHWQV